MRFTRVVVESFQAIQRAEVELGPGLNVIYGPNDLGKSTLATAIRAALLLPPTSQEAAAYAPWYADATPRVTLSFVDDSGQHWRVKKTFTAAASGATADLEHSKDGITYVHECKGREVEDRLRKLLGWGIPAPGGKGGPRGLPTSFLASALLATQTEVDALLRSSLDGDDGSGKLRLAKALATLAQDPTVKKVLEAAQAEVDRCFTATGRRKRGQGSKFTEATRKVTDLTERLAELERDLAESARIEQHLGALRDRHREAGERAGDARAERDLARERLERTAARAEARARLDEARAAFDEIERHAARVRVAAGAVETAAAEATTCEAALRTRTTEKETAETALRTAEEAHRAATSEDGAREREIQRAQLAEQAATLASRKQTAEHRRGQAEAAFESRRAAEAARREREAAEQRRDQLRGGIAALRAKSVQAEREVELARVLIAFGRWRDAARAAGDARRAEETAEKNRLEAAAKDAEAAGIEDRARAAEEDLAARSARLPTEEQARLLGKIEQAIKLAEAALGGGLSVAVRPREGVAVRGVVDDRPLAEASLGAPRVFEAERRVHLFVGDLVEIEVTAGAAEKRRDLEALRVRWEQDAVPLLRRAGLEAPDEVARALADLTRKRGEAADLRRSAERLRGQAQALRQQAAIHEEQAGRLAAGSGDLEARRAALGDADHALLEAQLAKLGKPWEPGAEAAHAAKASQLRAQKEQVQKADQELVLSEQRASDAGRLAEERRIASDAAIQKLGSPDPEALSKGIRAELTELARHEAETAARLGALVTEAKGRVDEATNARTAAQAQLTRAREAEAQAGALLEQVRARRHAGQGELGALRARLAEMDRAGAEALVTTRTRELDAIPGPDGSEAEVSAAAERFETAERTLEELKEELHKAEGALTRAGGPALREDVDDTKEALHGARGQEQSLEVEADAWKLLRDTLRAVENEEGAHLGRALAEPLNEKLGELTGGRYQTLRLDAALRTEAVGVTGAATGGADVLDALSVGTRAQLATLIRLTIADQLKHAIVLDDHLVHTDPTRLAWFRDALMRTAPSTQVVVLTCRPSDYLAAEDLPVGTAVRDLAGGALRAIDAERLVKRWAVVPSLPFYPEAPQPSMRAPFAILPLVEDAARFRDALPVYDLAAAAGAFSRSQAPEAIGWARVASRHTLDPTMFAARIVGDSMEPGVSNGAWVIFRRHLRSEAPPPNALDGRRVVVELRDGTDPETGGRYTFKRFRVTRFDADGNAEEVELRADNPAYAPRRFTAESGEMRVVAEYVETVG